MAYLGALEYGVVFILAQYVFGPKFEKSWLEGQMVIFGFKGLKYTQKCKNQKIILEKSQENSMTTNLLCSKIAERG